MIVDLQVRDSLILVDGSSYLYRAFNALPPLVTSSGQPTGAIKGVLSMLRRLQADYPEGQLIVVFDAPGKTFRDDMFSEYKAHRPPMPDDLRDQIKPLHELIKATGLPILSVQGVEADDVIGTLARQSECNTIIATGDKDLAQLVNDRVTLIDTMKNKVMDHAGVVEKFGIEPALVRDYLALMGDSSDNIPGVPGVGHKTAQLLVQKLGSLDAIYANLESIATLGIRGGKTLPDKLTKYREQAFLSRDLATIRTDVDLGCDLTDLTPSPADHAGLLEMYKRFEFRRWAEELLESGAGADEPVTTPTAPSTHYEVVLEQASFERWLARLSSAPLFSFDTETTSLDYMEAEIVGVSFAVEPYEAAYIPMAHDYEGVPQQLDRDTVLQALKPLLEDAKHAKVGQNLKYDQSVLARHGINLAGIAFDTMLESYVLDPSGSRHDMDTLAAKYLGVQTVRFEEVAGKGSKQLTFDQITLEQAAPYAAEDADMTLRLHQHLWPAVEREDTLRHIFAHYELPLVTILSHMERHGVLVDVAQLKLHSEELGLRLGELQEQAWALAGESFNLASPKQLQSLLFEKLELPVLKKTPKGQPSTAEEVLFELGQTHELPRLVHEHRGLNKLKSTYTDKLPKMVKAATGRVHTSYHQAGTATGRLSSSDPNLQNIPIRTEQGRRIRKAFVAPPGQLLVAADYSQVELRIMAHFSCDQNLVEAFMQGRDIHSATAAEVFGVSEQEVSIEQRRRAKAINFGLIYGMSAFGLAKQLDLTRKQAQRYIDLYFDRYPGVKNYMEQSRQRARELGYVETLHGRRLHLPDIHSRNKMRQQGAERTAINAPLQGTAADIIKRAMIDVDHWLRHSQLQATMIMQVHDELVLEVAEAQCDQVCHGLKEVMAGAAQMSVPLEVDVGFGQNWDQAH